VGGRGLGSRLLAAGKVAMPSWRPASELEGGDEFAKSEREITLSLADLLITWMIVLIQNILTNLKHSNS